MSNPNGRPPISILERLADKILVGDECWEWTAYRQGGYGRFGSGSTVLAHRIMQWDKGRKK